MPLYALGGVAVVPATVSPIQPWQTRLAQSPAYGGAAVVISCARAAFVVVVRQLAVSAGAAWPYCPPRQTVGVPGLLQESALSSVLAPLLANPARRLLALARARFP